MVKILSTDTRNKIKSLRQIGYSLPEIAKELKIGKATASRYARDIQILPEYIEKWKDKQGGSIKRMLNNEISAQEKAKNTIYSLTDKEKIIFLSALYWGEGGKKDFNFINSDPELIKVFIGGLQHVFGVSQDRIKVSIRIFEDLNRKSCIQYWSRITGIPVDKITNVTVLNGKKTGKLEYGMCRVRVSKGGDMLKYIKAIYRRVASLSESS